MIIIKMQGFLKDLLNFSLKFKDFSRISWTNLKFNLHSKDCFQAVSTLYMYVITCIITSVNYKYHGLVHAQIKFYHVDMIYFSLQRLFMCLFFLIETCTKPINLGKRSFMSCAICFARFSMYMTDYLIM